MSLDSIAYRFKQRHPGVYAGLVTVAGSITALRHGRARNNAVSRGTIKGIVRDAPAVIRPLVVDDLDALSRFFTSLPDSHFKYFRPHGFSSSALRKVLKSPAYICYGVFRDGEIIAYCLIKLFPTKHAYGGRIASPRFTGIGLGKYMWRYLIWQCTQLGVKPNSTIHNDNLASLGSLRAVQPNIALSPLPGGYQRIEIPIWNIAVDPPELNL